MRGGLALLLALALPRAAAADSNDLVMSRLATRTTDAMGNITAVVPDSVAFRALASELGVVLAPHLMTPADTIGFDGFQFTIDVATTTIDSTAPYWRAREGSANPAATSDGPQAPASLRTVGFFARKGLWFPVPSFEVGAGAVHLADSNIWTGQLYAKLALAEGYHDLPLPSLAVRGAVSRVMNQRELDLTIASVDVVISKHVGIGGTWRFDPYLGWDLLAIIPRSEVIDPTPNISSQNNVTDNMLNFVFADQQDIFRNRVLVGAKFQYSVLQITVEAAFALAGTSVDDRGGTNDMCTPGGPTTACDTKDIAKAQRTISMSAGFDF